jgi:uncharacterized membrane protein YciS (DUF1049 family)
MKLALVIIIFLLVVVIAVYLGMQINSSSKK